MEKLLIVGGNKGIGAELFEAASNSGMDVSRTSRNKNGDNISLELSDKSFDSKLMEGFTCAFICAAVSGFANCESDPDGTSNINVNSTVRLATTLIERGCHVIFLSSSAVFDGSLPWPSEREVYSPTTEYGRQKMDTERQLLKLDIGRQKIAIVRLTKVLSSRSAIVERFVRELNAHSPFDVFEDLKISPISMAYTVSSLLTIASLKCTGIYHLSGDREVSYAKLATEIATISTLDHKLIRSVNSAGTKIYFKPKYPGLGMEITSSITKLKPEPLGLMLENLHINNNS